MSDDVFRTGERRIFVSSRIEDEAITWALNDEDAHYLTRVLRLPEGSAVDIADGSGRLFQGVLSKATAAWLLTELHLIHEVPLAAPRLLAAALIKGDRWEWMLEKAAEIGADRILPIQADRSVVTIPDQKIEKRLARWSKIVESAARQCERLNSVTIDAPADLATVLQHTEGMTRLMLDEAVPTHPWPAIERNQAIVVFIGPEGGWTDQERARLHNHHVMSCGLGDNLLRAETAAIAALTLVRAIDARLLPRTT